MVRRSPRDSAPPIKPDGPPRKPPPPPVDDEPRLTRASITFHTNDEDKDHDTSVGVYVSVEGERTQVAYIYGELGPFADHTDAGPFTLVLQQPVPRSWFGDAVVEVGIDPVTDIFGGGDTWRFDFVLDLVFSDGGHLFSRANDLELATFNRFQKFGVE